MKFLVLALCVCAASAASFGSSTFGNSGYKNYKGFQNPVVAPAVVASKAVASVFAPVAAPVAQAAVATYAAAKQVVNKPYSEDSQAAIVRSESTVDNTGYKYSFETGNGISAEAVGSIKQVGDAGVIVSQGAYRYNAPDGTPVLVTYVADENGYQPQSDLLPVGPPIPEAIARALVYIAAHPSKTAQNY